MSRIPTKERQGLARSLERRVNKELDTIAVQISRAEAAHAKGELSKRDLDAIRAEGARYKKSLLAMLKGMTAASYD